jgi:hypothetical protein
LLPGPGSQGGTPRSRTAGPAVRNPDTAHSSPKGNRSVNVMMVRAKIKEENVADAQAATEKIFQALDEAQPDVRYAVTRLGDGVTLLAFLELEPGQEHPLRTFPAYAELLEGLKQWYAEPPTVEHMTVIGSYRLL